MLISRHRYLRTGDYILYVYFLIIHVFSYDIFSSKIPELVNFEIFNTKKNCFFFRKINNSISIRLLNFANLIAFCDVFENHQGEQLRLL